MDWIHDFHLAFWIALDIVSFAIRIYFLVVLPKRHSVTTATAWLFVILLWPWPGSIAYYFFGTNVLPARRMERHAAAVEHFKGVRARFRRRDLPGAVVPHLPSELRATENLAQNLGYMRALDGNSVRYLTDAVQFVNTIVEEIDAAREEVNLLYYIFSDDYLGKKVINACQRAVKRGVTVRLLVDSVGSRAFLKGKTVMQMRAEGIFVAEALPTRIYRLLFGRFDLRNHRKLAIFDKKIAVTGSHNLTEPTYGRKDGLVWKDVSLHLCGPVVRQLESVFIEDWFVETGEQIDTEHLFTAMSEFPGSSCLQTVPSGPSYQTENYQRLIIASIVGARKQVTITTPYLIPDQGMLQAIEIARLRGVKIRLALPARSDQIITGYASRAYYGDFLRLGVDLYLYPNGLLHAKTVTIDNDLGFVGSSNFDIRSFALNFEINMMLYGKEENLGIHGIQEYYIGESKLLTQEEWQQRNFSSRSFESVTKLFSPLL